MADVVAQAGAGQSGAAQGAAGGEVTKRDFLKLTTTAFAVVGVGAIAWPFVSYMAPSRDVLALASTEVDLSPIAEGQSVTVMWRGKPVFVRNRTPKEIEEARAVPLAQLKDPATDQSRIQRDPWLVVVGVCTHLGCVPLGQKPTDPKGDYDGWFCPCHGSHYDSSARIRKGPAPSNLEVPTYSFMSDKQIRIG
ncbi:MAG: ubiquinol-cytochrome c reductase iron-sulfur subunit [Rubritepida sp.]|jgi:ubiquinol-cytochrome c reductase iron-sulfur subunit|nr:ubiquinol-cytochrome c reductase iron-sulfur subunit [Rubritepida sp.]